MKEHSASRRRFLKTTAATAVGAALPAWTLAKGAPAIVQAGSERPLALQGLSFGDPSDGSVVVWSRSDRPARMLVEWSYDELFTDARRLRGPHALDTTDFTVKQAIDGLEAGSEVFVRVSFQSLNNDRAVSEPVLGRFFVPPDPYRDDNGDGHAGFAFGQARTGLRFLWGGDTAGQGWGINTDFGGMRIY